MAPEVTEWDDDEFVDEDSIPGCGYCAWCHDFILADSALDLSGWYGELCLDCGRKAQESLTAPTVRTDPLIPEPEPRSAWERILVEPDDFA